MVGVEDATGGVLRCLAVDAGEECLPVELGREELVSVEALGELVAQIELVGPIPRAWVGLRLDVAQCRKGEEQRRQALLPVDNDVGRHAPCRAGERSQHEAAEEVGRTGRPGRLPRGGRTHGAVLDGDVLPELKHLGTVPHVGPLEDGNAVLLLTLDEGLEGRLSSLHVGRV